MFLLSSKETSGQYSEYLVSLLKTKGCRGRTKVAKSLKGHPEVADGGKKNKMDGSNIGLIKKEPASIVPCY